MCAIELGPSSFRKVIVAVQLCIRTIKHVIGATTLSLGKGSIW